ncbi:MAG TPA: HAD-IIIA family hydrolase [Solirubrobacteraceae bacterium]|nr:HAD-IIIA family hydrolase [Solirubrobacteraceae bacterium]
MIGPRTAIVVPTTGRPGLAVLLCALGPGPETIVLVDDRPGEARPLGLDDVPFAVIERVRIVRSHGRGPAAARNAGWRAAPEAEWIAFLDDDVVPGAGWRADLSADLEAPGGDVAAVQGRVRVPLPAGRRPTDWERNVAALRDARWITADLAVRRTALERVGGFDERFPRAYREDADLGLRLTGAGWRITAGRRAVVHPVGDAGVWVSVGKQAGNADDALMDALHGPGWRERAGAPAGRRRRHLAVTAAGAAALAASAAAPWLRRRAPRAAVAAAAVPAVAWLGGTAELAWARIALGPRTPAEVGAMLATSALLPAAATGHWLAGLVRARRLVGAGGGPVGAAPSPAPVAAVLFDRDDTLVADVPYNGEPARVVPMPGAVEAVRRVRAAGLPVGVVSNQSGVARGLLAPEQVDAVNARVDELVGPFDAWAVCPHGPGDGCGCRKPAPGLVRRAAAALGVAPEACLVIGDIGADVEAARAAGARGVLVPTARTRPEEVRAAPHVAPDLLAAVGIALAPTPEAMA